MAMRIIVAQLVIIFTLAVALIATMLPVEVANANFYMPPANTLWTIEYPQNSTYDTNFFELRFRVETNLGLLYFYSLDGQPKKEINTTTLSSVPLPEHTPFIDGTLWSRRTHQGTAELPCLPKGRHELAIYQIYPLSPKQPENGNIVSQALVIFNVTSDLPENPLPTANPSATPVIPSATPSASPTPTISQSPTLRPKASPSATPPSSVATTLFAAQSPIIQPSPTWRDYIDGPDLHRLLAGILIMMTISAFGALVYFKIRKKQP